MSDGSTPAHPVSFAPDDLVGDVRRDGDATPLDDTTTVTDDAAWYVAETDGAGLGYGLPDGALADASHLATDVLLDGDRTALFQLRLHERGPEGGTFVLRFGLLNQCQARVRLPLDAVAGAEWDRSREGAWCKPMVGGDRVDPVAVDRVELLAVPWTGSPVRWCQSALGVTAAEPPRLDDPALPAGPLLDEFGQSTIHEWGGRTESETELVERLRRQRRRAEDPDPDSRARRDPDGRDYQAPDSRDHRDPDGRDRWGGWTGRTFEATGFFRTHHDGDRWWLVTPDGHPFWSAGLDCVRPNVITRYDGLEDALAWLPDGDGEFAPAHETGAAEWRLVNYLKANLVRAFGPDEWRDGWSDAAFAHLGRTGFNTVGNWSEWERASERGVPYVRHVDLSFSGVDTVCRDFPDVFHPEFPAAAADLAAQLESTVGDPAMVGYFLGNQPDWSFGSESLAAGMLSATETCACRRELADWLAERHGGRDVDGNGGLADAWGMDVTLDDVRGGEWDRPLSEGARADLDAFSARMVDRLYAVVTEACRSVDPDHLVLGSRFAGSAADWELAGMDHVDVLSYNCYRPRVADEYAAVAADVDAPVLVGEFHFGALDAGLPAPGKQRVEDQAARGDAYRVYLEDAAARPWCVGAHYFSLYDQSALGRFDGSNLNIGFLDTCHRPYELLVEAARASHDRLYGVATGEREPYDDEPEYLSDL